ncbi:DUF7426 family protein [Gordonia sp. DT219]|uniref:DUF7426 family protein n=1 Tax=Gordonia sp. DT219 TaxID=3416658 RepID=UPI003CFB19BC
MGFDALSIQLDGIQLPIEGKTYTIPEMRADDGLKLTLQIAKKIPLSDEEELAMYMGLLGAEWVSSPVEIPTGEIAEDGTPVTITVDDGTFEGGVYSEMVNDGVPWRMIVHAARTVFIDAVHGRTTAEIHWQTALTGDLGNPPPPEPGENRKTRRAAAKKAAPRKASTKSASGGRTRASQAPTE